MVAGKTRTRFAAATGVALATLKEPSSERPEAERLADLAALRLALTGESPIDLGRLWFNDSQAVDRFLRLAEYYPDNNADLDRLHDLHHEATSYLREAHHVRLPRQILRPGAIQDLFLAASRSGDRLQHFACMTLKVMHILNHVGGRELTLNLPFAEAELFSRLNAKVIGAFERLRSAGIAVQEFSASKKARASVVTKLLARRGTLATHIFDRLRFRLIVATPDDVVMALAFLMRHLFPFSFVVPEQSRNGIVTVDLLSRALDLPRDVVLRAMRAGDGGEVGAFGPGPTPPNEFSGRSYRTVSLVAEIPVRLDDVLPQATPAVAFAQTEVQLVDQETEAANNAGDNAHAKYKKRQLATVRRRLERS